jgi:hypothetical protein
MAAANLRIGLRWLGRLAAWRLIRAGLDVYARLVPPRSGTRR